MIFEKSEKIFDFLQKNQGNSDSRLDFFVMPSPN